MRGFVTIATGSDLYYQLAVNLLRSYRKNAVDNTPFAIICDRETEETREFDDVVLMEKANCSYMDKLLLWHYTPYEETIFIDADSLILSDPNGMWDDFSDEDDVSCYGCQYPLDSDRAWFTHDGTGTYKSKIKFLIDLHGGIYYLRKSDRCISIFEKAIELAANYHEYSFKNFDQPADEPVLAMSMAIHQSIPCNKAERVLFVPSYWGRLSVTPDGRLCVDGKVKNIEVLHFATSNTKRFIYRYMVDAICEMPAEGRENLTWRYVRMRIKTLPIEVKAHMRHSVGSVLRRFVSAQTVDRLKKNLRS